MKRRSKAGGRTSKARGREALKAKRLDASKTASSSAPIEDAEVARLTRELSEALERLTSTSEVLGVISRSKFELQPLLQSVAVNAARLCRADGAAIFRLESGFYRFAAGYSLNPAELEIERLTPIPPGPGTVVGRAAITRQVARIDDAWTDPLYEKKEDAKIGGSRSMLGVPLMREGEPIGVIGLARRRIDPFSEREIELVTNFANQAVIAIENARLLNELRQRTTDLTERTADLTEALEQQTATSEVLQVISSSPGDLQPVFATMLEQAVRICDAVFGNIYRWDGAVLNLLASHNMTAFAQYRSPSAISAGTGVLGRMLNTKKVVHVADLAADPAYAERNPLTVTAVEMGGVRTILAVPMLKDNELIGAFTVSRQEVRPFTDKQIALVTNFAAQALIAIENARLLNELRQRTTDLTERTADLTEALEQQTATSEVLQVISSSPGDLQPVFATMLESAARICGANFGNIFRWDGDTMHLVATHNTPPAFAEARRVSPLRPLHLSPKSLMRRMVTTKTTIHVADIVADAAYAEQHDPAAISGVELGGIRTILFVPMLKESELIGSFTVYRQEVRPFTDKQIELVQNFAAQAVIAIENARLLNELRQSLAQQTATADVLKVISRSTFDLQAVLNTLVLSATSLCVADKSAIWQRDGEFLRLWATNGVTPEAAQYAAEHPLEVGRNSAAGRAALEGEAVHILDVLADAEYSATSLRDAAGYRTVLGVPLLRAGTVIGVFALTRREVSPFSEKQIELVTTFADQAVIAIENARLLNELRQSLEEQTATSDVLRVISSSPGELEPVLAAILASATRICEAEFGNLFLREEDAFRAVAWHGEPTYVNTWRGPALTIKTDVADIPLARLAATKQRVHVADLRQEAAYEAGFAPLVALVDKGGARTLLIVPMLKEQTLVGAITIYRQEVRPFTDKQIALVENFAAQAVIAIENARLLRELRERTEDVVKLNQQLEQRVTDQVDEIERMSRLRRFLPPQVADLIVASGSEKQLESHRREITALFCDLRGFTGFTESADAEDVMALLREYHAAIGEIIIKYNGTLERYAGDGVMVVFNDPVPVENPALQAVLMALEVRDAIGALTETWRRLGHDIGFGIGIAHGFATLGTIGFEGRFDYAAIGTVSNVASRLCDEAKPGQILISPRVLVKVENAVQVEPVGEFELKGIRRPLAAYNVVAAVS